MLYKDTKAMVHSPYADANYFDIVIEVWKGDTLALFLFTNDLDYLQWVSIDRMKRKWSRTKKLKSTRYPTEIKTDADFVDDLALGNRSAQVVSLMYGLEQASRNIGRNWTQIKQSMCVLDKTMSSSH